MRTKNFRSTEDAYQYLANSGVSIITHADGCQEVVLSGMEGIGAAKWRLVNEAARVVEAANPHCHMR